MKITNKKFIEVDDWDELIIKTYGRPYKFQQQDDCRGRGIHTLSVPSEYDEEAEMNDYIPELVNGSKMGVKFAVWLDRDPKQQIPGQEQPYQLNLFWERNFYPNINTVANDLYNQGLLGKGEYIINIDW